MGLKRDAVKKAVENNLQWFIPTLQGGKPLNVIITVGGKRLQYTAYKLPNGTINVGRIHGI